LVDAAVSTSVRRSTTSPNFAGLTAAGPAALITFGVFFVFGEWSVPIVGDVSMAWRIAISSIIVAPIAFLWGTWRITSEEMAAGYGARETYPEILLRMIALAGGTALFAYYTALIFGAMFEGYVFEWIFSAVFPAVFAGGVAYAAAAWAVRRWFGDIVMFALAVVGLAILLAAVESGAGDWWKAALSSLGTAESLSWRIFNVGAMVAGGMLIFAAPSTRKPMKRAADLHLVTERTARLFAWGLALLGLQLFVVGLVPMDSGDVGFAIHNVAGVSLGAVLIVAMAASKWIMPGLPKLFFWYSWVFGALSLLSVPLYPLGYFSLAELEVVVFGFGALWALLMLASLRDGGL
jgi:hypothetical protein